ncbi:peptidylprolyl isomerase [Alkalimonas collagenimarina]|uniref:Peptidyl-prolyl cis-trans isomerase n=1 Tax=Alkalimonas collagenimarina TaxID=400390 RepID=A0ABT9GY94_9GAMM|nr:peptidylprolyl isomerase [Alkalimonas collagenimarina]MDP4536029.1 peptidylprolyl isomerase [Alkalimonas collagenimarina]
MKPYQSALAILCFVLTSLSASLQATIVEFKTSLGDFEVNLFDEITPETVENFLEYVQQESYHHNVIHRSIPGFIIQGGGFVYDDERPDNELPLSAIAANAAITNEPELSNRRGTIAMAKLEYNPNSATNQWFFNLDNNSANLDAQNGGFTVFGQVSAQGLEVIDAIAALPRYNLDNGVLSDVPLRNYTSADAAAGVEITEDNWVFIESVVVVDARTDTASGLNPVANEAEPEIPWGDTPSSGSIGWSLLALLICFGFRRSRG